MQPVDVSSYTCVLASSVLLTFYGCTVLNIVPLWYLVRLYSQPEAEMLRYFSLPGLFFPSPSMKMMHQKVSRGVTAYHLLTAALENSN